MILYINSSQKDKFTMGLYKNKLILKTVKSPTGTMSEKFLPALDKFLKDNPPASPKRLSFGGRGKINIKNLSAIIVFQGPGSYTSLRIGISIGNALAWGLNIPIFAIKKEIDQKFIKTIQNKVKKHHSFSKAVRPYYQQEIK